MVLYARLRSGLYGTRIVQLAGLLFAVLFSPACGDDPTPLYGAPTPSSCQTEPKAYYGPPPCQSDQQCVDQNGANWYCDKNRIIDEKCGVKWPTCAKR